MKAATRHDGTSRLSSKAETDFASCSARAVAAPSCCCRNSVPCDCSKKRGWGVSAQMKFALHDSASVVLCSITGPQSCGFERTPMSASCARATAANAITARSNPVAALARAMSGVRAPSRKQSFLGGRSSAVLVWKCRRRHVLAAHEGTLMHLSSAGVLVRSHAVRRQRRCQTKGHIEASADHRTGVNAARSPRACAGTPHGKHTT